MKNRVPGICDLCNEMVSAGEGILTFEGARRLRHEGCGLLYRGRTYVGMAEDRAVAQGVGPAARKARARLRKLENEGGR